MGTVGSGGSCWGRPPPCALQGKLPSPGAPAPALVRSWCACLRQPTKEKKAAAAGHITRAAPPPHDKNQGGKRKRNKQGRRGDIFLFLSHHAGVSRSSACVCAHAAHPRQPRTTTITKARHHGPQGNQARSAGHLPGVDVSAAWCSTAAASAVPTVPTLLVTGTLPTTRRALSPGRQPRSHGKTYPEPPFSDRPAMDEPSTRRCAGTLKARPAYIEASIGQQACSTRHNEGDTSAADGPCDARPPLAPTASCDRERPNHKRRRREQSEGEASIARSLPVKGPLLVRFRDRAFYQRQSDYDIHILPK